jgi:succinoglycan biosynthesis protein ExoO
LARLLAAAEADGADIVADDLLTFYDSDTRAPHAHLRGVWAKAPTWVGAAAYERSNRMLGDGPALGYLKPLFRRVGPGGAPRYDESLRIGEDSDLVLGLLIGGWRFRIYPELGYFYRKHSGSVSHRLDRASLDALAAANKRVRPGADADLARELAAQGRALADARSFAELVEALKARDLRGALRAAIRRPSMLWLLKEPIGARLFPARKRKARPKFGPPRVTLLSRQRIVGQTNGSSAYVLAIAEALTRAGFGVEYIGASPKIFGRWAAIKLKPETGVFVSYRIHGGFRFGSLMLARDPSVWIASALAVAVRGLGKLGIKVKWSAPADYAQGAPATREDMLFVAAHTARNSHAILCDYAFLNPLAPYSLRPGAPVFTIMHDLMSARVADAAEANTVTLAAAAEFRLLSLANVVVAIQADEAEKVRAALPHTQVIVAQHAVATVSAPQPGADDTLLFVGSNTAPNIVGLAWFFREVWPLVRQKRPRARLLVAGSVARGLGAAPDGVKMLGVIGDLAPLYRDAGVVISPLYTGSGLKIKLIEALAAGKAVVGTSVTVQGVEDVVVGAMAREDEPARFAAALAALLGDAGKRHTLARAALECARTHFSAEACLAELVSKVRGGAVAPAQKSLQPARATSQ